MPNTLELGFNLEFELKLFPPKRFFQANSLILNVLRFSCTVFYFEVCIFIYFLSLQSIVLDSLNFAYLLFSEL